MLCAAINVALDKDLRDAILSFMYIPPEPTGWGLPREVYVEYDLMTAVKKRDGKWGKARPVKK